MHSTISFPVAASISTNNSVKLCPSFNLKALASELLYQIWPYRGSFIICPDAYNPIYTSSDSSCLMLHLYITVRQYGSFGPNFFSIKSSRSSKWLPSLYNAWSWLLDVWSLLLLGNRPITTMKVVYGNSGTLRLGLLPTSAKNISVRAEWLRQSGRAPSEPSETPRWRITPRPASIPRVALHIALRSPFLLALSVS